MTRKKSYMGRTLLSAFYASLVLPFTGSLQAQSLNERVLVVYSTNYAGSQEVAEYYRSARNIPASHLCPVTPASSTVLTQAQYEASVKAPIQACLNAVGRRQILYIVMSYGTPYKFFVDSRGFAIDSALADIWDENLPTFAQGLNPPEETHDYYAEAQSLGKVYAPFVSLSTHRMTAGTKTIYSVWRLDASSAAIAKGLVDKAKAVEAGSLSGIGCFDRRTNLDNAFDFRYSTGDFDILRAAEFVAEAGFSMINDQNYEEFGTPPAPPRCDGAAFYTGWYSLNAYPNVFTWNPGAIGFHIDSASAVDPRGGTNFASRAVQAGITITAGSVFEPYLEGLVHPDGFFRNLLEGSNVGDAMLRNLPWLKWMNLSLGDPLYIPFPGGRPPFHQPRGEDGLHLTPHALVGGTPVTGTVLLSTPAPPGGASVTLSSTRPTTASVPSTVPVPAGQTSATFPITTTRPTQDTNLMIQATWGGVVRKNSLYVVPLLAPLNAQETSLSGSASTTGNVNLYAEAPSGGITVSLASDNPALVIPSSVVVPAGESSVPFTILTTPVAVTVNVTITATQGGTTRTLVIRVLSPAVSSLTFNPSIIYYPGSSSGAIVLTSAAPTGGMVVSLSSSSAALSFPPSVTVPAGSTSATFPVTSQSAGSNVSIAASAGGSAKSATIYIRSNTPTGPTGYWNFDEGAGILAHDTSGNGFNANIMGATPVAGKINAALKFNGTTNTVVTPSIPLSASFSISAWVNPTVTSQVSYARIAETRYNSGLYLGTDAFGRKYKFIVNNGSGSGQSCAPALGCVEGGVVTAGWHLITGTFDGTTARLYVDTALVATGTFTAPPFTNYPLYIGRNYAGNGSGWNGAIDEVRLYDRALTSAEVAGIYNYVSADTVPPTVSISTPAPNAAVSNVVTVSAGATDNVAVASVQFKLDGTNLGAAVTTAPYTLSWDTRLVSNGAHTLTAVATDTSQNITTSAAIPVTVNNAAPVPTQGLRGYWNYDEASGSTAFDRSGNGYHAAISGAAWAAGKTNSGLSFSSPTNDVVSPNIALGSTFSISAWVHPSTTSQSAYARIAENIYNVGFYLGVDRLSRKYKFIVKGGLGSTGSCGSDYYGCAEGGTITAGWHLITGTFDGTTAKLYVDDALVASDTFTAPPNTNYRLHVGRYASGNYNGWKGLIDEVRLYNRALTAAEVSSLFSY